MQSVATGQVLGKLLVQCRELDLGYTAEMSAVKTPRSLENSKIRGWSSCCCVSGLCGRSSPSLQSAGGQRGHRASATCGKEPIAERVTLMWVLVAKDQVPARVRALVQNSLQVPGRWAKGLQNRAGRSRVPSCIPARDAPNRPARGVQCGSTVGCV